MTHGRSACLFEGTVGNVSLDDLDAKLSGTAAPCPGNADCLNAAILDHLLERWPDARLVVVTRDTDAVAVSLRRLGMEYDPRLKHDICRGMDKAKHLDALVVPFQDLGIVEVGAAIWQHCTGGTDFDARRWQMLDELKIEARPEVEDRKIREHASAMKQFLGGLGK